MPLTLQRGDVVACPDGGLHVVWSVTLGVVHAVPATGNRSEMAAYVNGKLVYLASAERRHFPVADVHLVTRVTPSVVAELEMAMRHHERVAADERQQKRRDHCIRVAARQAARRRDGRMQAAVFA